VTDAELVEKKLAFIATCVRELRSLAIPDRIATDVKEERFVEHTLQIAIQAALDVASHIVSDEKLGEPTSLKNTFELLVRAGFIAPAALPALSAMAGFRNIVVHAYQAVDVAVVRDIVEHHLGDLESFVESIRAKVTR